jgi:hypothetical protein
VKVIPVSLKFTHLTTLRETITARMRQLGTDSGYEFAVGSSVGRVHAVLGLGQHILRSYLERHELAGEIPADRLPLFRLLENFAVNLVEGVDNGLGLPSSGSPLTAPIPSPPRSFIPPARPGARWW